MIDWVNVLVITSLFFSVVSFFPITNFQHWVFRIFDFIRLQLVVILTILLVAVLLVSFNNFNLKTVVVLAIVAALIYHIAVIYPYIPKNKNQAVPKDKSKVITLVSVNVKQENDQYQKVIDLTKNKAPDILLTMETDKNWENGLQEIEDSYSYCKKVAKSNRYGMHLYTNLTVKDCEVHYLISEDYPSIEIMLEDHDGKTFIFWGIHPPPPSPTEKTTSKQKDAELIKAAKILRDKDLPVLVTGDFNNVGWSKVSKLFAKVSGLTDGRVNTGIFGTFPASLKFLRFPLDLLFHSKTIEVYKIETLKSVNSDHLPLLAEFNIKESYKESKEDLDDETKGKLDSIVKEGEKAAEKDKK